MTLGWNLKRCLITISLVGVILEPAAAVTLTNVVQDTLASNPQIFAAAARHQGSEYGIKEAKAGYLPQIDIRVARGYEHSQNPSQPINVNSADLERRENQIFVNQLLFAGGRVYFDVKEKEALADSAHYQLNDTSQRIALQTVEAYLNLWRTREIVRLAQSNVKIHRETYNKVKKLYDQGAGQVVDVDLATSRLALAESRLLTSKDALNDAESSYLSVTGLALPQQLSRPNVPERFLPKEFDGALQTALQKNPQILATRADLQAAGASVKQARSQFFPTLNIELSASENDNLDGLEGPNRDVMAMGVFNYNLFRGGADYYNYMKQGQRRVQNREILEQTKRNISERLRIAWSNYKINIQQVKRLNVSVDNTVKVVAGYRKQFTLGKRQLFNVLDEESDLFESRVSLVNAEVNKQIAVYRIFADMGILLSHI